MFSDSCPASLVLQLVVFSFAMLEGQLEAPRLGMLSPLPQAGRMLVDPAETICLAAVNLTSSW
jgi:hypothetical protein